MLHVCAEVVSRVILKGIEAPVDGLKIESSTAYHLVILKGIDAPVEGLKIESSTAYHLSHSAHFIGQ